MPGGPGRLILAIETSNPSAGDGSGVALADPGAGWTDVEPLRRARQNAPGTARAGHGGQDDDLMPAIERVFARRAARAGDVGRVMVSVGPGGYTGLRIACAVGKMIAEAAGATCVAVPTAMVVARRVDAAVWSRGGVAVALASKADSAWIQRVERDGRAQAGRVCGASAMAALAGEGVCTVVADRFFPGAMRDAAAGMGVAVVEPVFDAGAILDLGVGYRSLGLREIDPVELVPLYPREPDAVTLWRERKRT